LGIFNRKERKKRREKQRVLTNGLLFNAEGAEGAEIAELRPKAEMR
jgi:hypothetical protein